MLASELPEWAVRGIAFVFGALWGSFFNVAVYRWPRGMSVVTPPSHCPACQKPIPASRNVPIVGWLVLRGRAACCGAKISPRYPLVETLSALICVALAERYWVNAPAGTELVPAMLQTLAYFAFAGGLIVATFVDLDHLEIPDEVSLPGAALGLATAPLRSEPGAEDAALGAGGGFLVVQMLFVWSYERITGRRGMGEGDSKLMLMIGAFVGWKGALFAIVAGAMQGLVVAVAMLAIGKSPTPVGARESESESESESVSEAESEAESESVSEAESESESVKTPTGQIKVPFGPFLALAAIEFLFFGDELIDWYLSWF